MAKFKVGARQLQTKRQAKDTASQIGLVWPCGAYRPKIVTNADRIRSMTDEELAQFLGDEPPYFATYKQYIDWLRQPIESEGEEEWVGLFAK